MEIKGIVLVTPLMYQMIEGQEGFLTTNAITVVNDEEVFIYTGSSISEIKDGDKYVLPIKRIGPNIDDFEIDFNIACTFYNNKCNEKEREIIKNRENTIGPFKIQVEVCHRDKYREQMYPRMDLEELIDVLIANNVLLDGSPDHDEFLANKAEIRRLIKVKLQKLSVQDLKTYQKTFSPLGEEDDENGTMVNYAADEKILNFIIQHIHKAKTQQKLEELPLEELKQELVLANEKEDFERSTLIRDIIKKKKNE